jgi:hypothetical protein
VVYPKNLCHENTPNSLREILIGNKADLYILKICKRLKIMKEYKWKSYTFDQNIENKINNKAAEGWEVKAAILRQYGVDEVGCTLYILYEKES